MILVMLGTQDKSFVRLLEAIDKAIENKVITEEVVVQAGYTNYKSHNMKIFDYITQEELNNYIKKCDYMITHAGVGSILNGLENNKKVIVIPRLSKYKEHTNDHQLQIAEEFSKAGYVIYLKELKELEKTLKNINNFKLKKLKHNNKIVEEIEKFIDSI